MPVCVVIMPFGATSPKHTEQYWKSHFEDYIKRAVDRAFDKKRETDLGYRAKIIRDSAEAIPAKVFQNLESADVVLADITDYNPNVLYELGFCHTLGKQTILILEDDQDIPFYFKTYPVIHYSITDHVAFATKIEEQLNTLHARVDDASVHHDNPFMDYFASERKRLMVLRELEAQTIEGFKREQIHTVYIPANNHFRNGRKNELLQEAEQHIRLLAHSGHSFLAKVGNRFRGPLTSKLQAGVRAQAVLLNPWSDSAVLIALGELNDRSPDELDDVQAQALSRLRQGEINGFDAVALIENSDAYEKFAESIRGYVKEFKPKLFGGQIELRICNYEPSVTLLLTEKGGFFEPYIHANLSQRNAAQMNTFELEFGSGSYLYEQSRDYFDALWSISLPYDDFDAAQPMWKARLRERYGG